MNPKELLDKARETPSVAFHTFVLLQTDFQNDLFCFYEGNDSAYYYPRIKEYYKGNHHPIICGNKKSVLRTFQEVSVKYPLSKTSFFIDRDFDEVIGNNKIYETSCYSIENLYTSKAVVIDVLKNEFNLSENDESFKAAINIFDNNQADYHEKSILFNAWYAVLRKTCNDKGIETNVNLNCAIPKEFVSIKIGKISNDYNLEQLQKKFPEAIVIKEKDVLIKIQEFRNHSLNKVLRGKFELEYIYEFFRFLIEDANTKEQRNIIKKKTNFRLDKAQILSQLSQYAETPSCLVKYICGFN